MSVEVSENRFTYLTFGLGMGSFALQVAQVREVLDVIQVTRVPNMPDYMMGVINLRGRAVPVVDMRIKLGMEAGGRTVSTCIIVVEVLQDGQPAVVGLMADSVKAVLELKDEDIEAAPSMGSGIEEQYISGMGRYEDGFLIILDIDRIFSGNHPTSGRVGHGDVPMTAAAS